MQGIGKILRDEREKKEISLETVSEATKIRTKYLKAIEDEQFDVLPGEVYARGFVTAYLKYLGIKDRPDAVTIMSRKIDAEARAIIEAAEKNGLKQKETEKTSDKKKDKKPEKKQEKKPEPEAVAAEKEEDGSTTPRVPFNAATTEQNLRSRRASRHRKKVLFEEIPVTQKGSTIIVITIIALLFLAGIGWGYTHASSRNHPAEEPPVQQDVATPDENGEDGAGPEGEEPQQAEEPAVAPEPAAPTELQMTIRVLDITPNQNDQCWMMITVDGKATEETMSEGQVKELVAKESIQLNMGNAGAVSITLNGQDLGIQGAKGKVLKKTWTLDSI